MFRLYPLIIVAALAGIVSTASAQVWNEVGDAGEIPATAQQTTGKPLIRINGTVANLRDSDLYCIHITDPLNFSAQTVFLGDTEVLDTQLYLFDENGKGLAASDDISDTDLFSRITSADTPVGPGFYLLGISAFDRDPRSAGGYIFPNVKFIGVKGPTGFGGADPLTHWSNTGFETGRYRVELRGVEGCVPEAPFAPAFGVAVALSIALRRRRRQCS